MNYLQALRNLKAQYRTDNNLDVIHAVVGAADGNYLDPVLRPGKVYVRGQRITAWINGARSGLTLAPGLHVIVEQDEYQQYYISRVDGSAETNSGADPNVTSLPPRQTATQGDFETLRVIADGVSLVLSVKAWQPTINGIAYEFAGSTIDIGTAGAGATSLVPGADLMAYVMVFLKSDIATLEAFASTPRSTSDFELGLPDRQECLDQRSTGSIPIWAIALKDDQSFISQADITTPPSVDMRNTMINSIDAGGMTSFNVDADSGGPATITDGETINFIGGTGIDTAISGNDITFNATGGTGDVVGPASAVDNDLAAFDSTTGKLIKDSGLLTSLVAKAIAALADKFLLQTADATNLPNAQAMSALGTGIVKNATTTGVQSIAIADTDYATPAYVNNAVTAAVNGLSPKADLALWTNAPLPAVVYANGSSGVGATLTGVSTGVLTVDGVAATAGMRIGVKNQVAGLQNGLYVVTVAGAIGVAFILTRTTDADTSTKLIGAYAYALQGAVNVDYAYICTNVSPITIGTDAITFATFANAGLNQLTGDGTAGPGTGSQALTLATVNSNVGTFSRVKSIIVNAKGLITAITQGLVDLASEITGQLPLANLADGATAGVPLVAGGGAGDPSYTAIDLTQSTAVSGALPINRGGTGQSAQTAAMDALSPTSSKGDMLVDNGTNVVVDAVGSNGQVRKADSTQTNGVHWVDDTGNANAIINGGFSSWQRLSIDPTVLTAYADGAYGSADLWRILTQSNSIQNARVAGDTRSQYAARLKQTNVTAQRMGYDQIIEAFVTEGFRSRAIRAQARINCSNNQPIYIAIVEWTGTADSPTSDIVNDWTDSSYTTGHFFISTTTAVVGFATITPAANTWTAISVTGTPSSSANNLHVFIWTGGTAAQNVTLDIAEVGLYDGTDAQTWMPDNPAINLYKCERYLKVLSSANTLRTLVAMGESSSATNAIIRINELHMRTIPALTVTAADWDFFSGPTAFALTALSLGAASSNVNVNLTGTSSGMTAAAFGFLAGDTGADRYLVLSAEL